MGKIKRKIIKKILKNNFDVPTKNEFPREAWLEGVLANIPAGGRILDAGAGTQRYKRYCSHLNYVSQDFGEYSGEGDGSALQMGDFDYGTLDIVSDITAIPESDGSFDAIMCIEVLEHLADPAKAIIEFSRLLKPGGVLILTAPFCSLTHFSPYHFSSGFNKYWYETHLVENNFTILSITANGNYFDYLAQEMSRVPQVVRQYTDYKFRIIDAMGLLLLKILLCKLGRIGGASGELLCFGYHALARKL